MSEDQIKWIKMPSFFNNQYWVHQVRCPKCKHTETYIGMPPENCYVCDERRRL